MNSKSIVLWGVAGCWILAIASIAFLLHLGSTGLVDETEPLFVEAARQMLITQDWITPYFNQETRFDKPPLIYWLMAIGYKLFGVSEWTARLPSALSAIFLVIFCFYTTRYLGFPIPLTSTSIKVKQKSLWLSAFIASALLTFNLQVIVWGRTGVSDMLLCTCISSALLSFFWGYIKASPLKRFYDIPHVGYLGFYLFTSLAVLTKGPVGIVLPVLIIVVFLIYIGKLRKVLQEIGVVLGGLLFTIITLPWYVLIIQRHGDDYISKFFGYHNLERFTSVVNHHAGPWYFYFPALLVLFFPWSIYLPVAISRLAWWRRGQWKKTPRRQQLGIFAFCWLVVVFLFFTVAVTKLPSYILPLMPAASILVALIWSKEFTHRVFIVYPSEEDSEAFVAVSNEQELLKAGDRSLFLSGAVNVFLMLVMALAFIYGPDFIVDDPAMVDLPTQIKASGIQWWGGLVWWLGAVIIAILLTRRRWWRWIVVANLLSFVAFFFLVLTPATFLIDQGRQLPLRQLAAVITQVQQPRETAMMIGFKKPSIVFYAQRPIKLFKNNKTAVEYVRNSLQETPDTVLIISRPQDIDKLHLGVGDFQLINTRGVYQLIRVPKETIVEQAKVD